MRDYTFYINGIDAADYGIMLQSPVKISAAIPVVETINVPGRNGSLVFYTGAYENRKGSAECYILGEDVDKAITGAMAFLLGEKGYRKFQTTEDPDHYMMARVMNGAEIDDRAHLLNPFTVEFDLMPQRFRVDGVFPIVFEASGNLLNQYSGVALPKITVHGNGAGAIVINAKVLNISEITDGMQIDFETCNAYKGATNLNSVISAPEFPGFVQGENEIEITGGVSSIEIVPRWWDV